MSENITNAFTFLDKLLSEFSWKRTLRLAVVLILLFTVAYLYESYSGHIHLSRLKKETELLRQLHEMKGADQSETLKPIYDGIVSDLGSAITNRTTNSTALTAFWKMFASLIPWALFLVIINFINKQNCLLYTSPSPRD